MFQKISDYTELLFPDNILREGSVIEQMISQILEDDWKDQVQIVGWLYQFYNSELKDQVFAALKKNIKISKENIPAATQLFTPDWIVRYMVENSLGKIWSEGHETSKCKDAWQYYLKGTEQKDDVQSKLNEIIEMNKQLRPETIKCIDPCSGSGHILVYLFEVLIQIYEDYGILNRDAVKSVITNNLWGLDIDERAAQLAYFSVMMKAVQYDRRFLHRKDDEGNPDVPQPHIYSIKDSNNLNKDVIAYFCNGNNKLTDEIGKLIADMKNAKEYGSIVDVRDVDFDAIFARFNEIKDEISLYKNDVFDQLYPFVQVARALSQKYNVTVTNPPYMSNRGMSPLLLDYVKERFPAAKSDLFSVFIER